MNYLLGIDLGTTNCSVTAVDEKGKTTVIKNRENEYITPSAVYFKNIPNSYIIGKKAKELASSDPKNLVTLVKREMGKIKEEVRYNKLHQEYNPYNFWGKIFSPEEISSKILNQLKQDAEKNLNCKIKRAVITCPAYFKQNEKEATRKAGEMAGLEVLEVIPEPTAACLNYAAISKKNEKVFVFDLGGGTFDVTIVDVSTGENGLNVEIKCCGGESKLGGADWDNDLCNYVIKCFDKKYYADFNYKRDDEALKARGKLMLEAERVKKELSGNSNTAEITLEYGGQKVTEVITRDKYKEITMNQNGKCKAICENLLSENNLSWDEIDTILMVGSMSRCFSIQEDLRKWSGKNIEFGIINPKTCVSEGAAIKAYGNTYNGNVEVLEKSFDYESNDEENIKKIEDEEKTATKVTAKFSEIKSVLPASICLKLLKQGQDFSFKMLQKNHSYPCIFEKDFPLAKDNMTFVDLTVLEGEYDEPSRNEELGKAVLELKGSHQKGDKVRVTFSIDNNGIIQIKGKDLKTNEEVKAEIRRNNSITEEEFEYALAASETDEFELG